MNAERLEALAEALHRAESRVVIEMFNVAQPLWFALAEEYKAPVRERAGEILDRYAERATKGA